MHNVIATSVLIKVVKTTHNNHFSLLEVNVNDQKRRKSALTFDLFLNASKNAFEIRIAGRDLRHGHDERGRERPIY